MKLNWTAIMAITALSTLLMGCGSVKYPNYYTLNLASVPDPPPPQTANSSLAIRQFRSVEYLRAGSIVYRSSPEQIGYYTYHRWAVDPRNVITNAVEERLRAQATFADVRLYDGHSDPDYMLSGRIEKLEEVDSGKTVTVEVALSARLVDVRTGNTVWTNYVSDSGVVEQRNVTAVVAEMSRTTDRAIQSLMSTMSVPTTRSGTIAKRAIAGVAPGLTKTQY